MEQNLNTTVDKSLINDFNILQGSLDFNSTNNLKNDSASDDLNSANEDDLSENDKDHKSGRWHPSEHFRFIKGCLQHGNNWKKVSKYFKLGMVDYKYYKYYKWDGLKIALVKGGGLMTGTILISRHLHLFACLILQFL